MADKRSISAATGQEQYEGAAPLKASCEAKFLNEIRCPITFSSRGLHIRLWWLAAGPGHQVFQRITFPTLDDRGQLQQLLQACSPAPFGRGGERVLDETYRKAVKLDTSDFMTDFCPYKAGIIDVVTQLLLPNFTPQFAENDRRSVKAELYSLNIYSAPSGKFKAHVDTPRSEAQFGSLVIILPVVHKGGELVVRGAEKQLAFPSCTTTEDSNPDDVQWAAFYSDCEHEVKEVTSGHRVTLTYSLYSARGAGFLAGHASTLNPTKTPLYRDLSLALDTPGFLQDGKVIGVLLMHSYVHTSEHCNFLPHSLKGSDMVVYETARALGLRCEVHPVMHVACEWHDMEARNFVQDSTHLVRNDFSGFLTSGHHVTTEPDGAGVHFMEAMMDGFSNARIDEGDVLWLNDMQIELQEPAVGFVTYGNSPAIDVQYSSAALFLRIPPMSERDLGYSDVQKPIFDFSNKAIVMKRTVVRDGRKLEDQVLG